MVNVDGGVAGRAVSGLIVRVEVLKVYKSSVLDFLQDRFLNCGGQERITKMCPWVRRLRLGERNRVSVTCEIVDLGTIRCWRR